MSRDRLVKLLGMLGSYFDGERATAARMIADMAKKEGKGVADYVMGGGIPQVIYRDRIVEKTVYRDRPVREAPPEPKRDYQWDADDLRRYRRARRYKPAGGAQDIIAGLRWASNFPEHLESTEFEFVHDILRKHSFDDELTSAQEKWAKRIIAKVKACEGESLI